MRTVKRVPRTFCDNLAKSLPSLKTPTIQIQVTEIVTLLARNVLCPAEKVFQRSAIIWHSYRKSSASPFLWDTCSAETIRACLTQKARENNYCERTFRVI